MSLHPTVQNHVPRWFTEGLAEYETLTERVEWRREQDRELYVSLAAAFSAVKDEAGRGELVEQAAKPGSETAASRA